MTHPFAMTRPVTPKGEHERACDVCGAPCKIGKVNGGSVYITETYEGAKIIMRFCTQACADDWASEDDDSEPMSGAIGHLGQYEEMR